MPDARIGLSGGFAEWGLVGRDEERAFVLDGVRAGRGGVMLAGAAGVGKTRLAHEALASQGRGVVVESVLATAAAASVPLGAFAHLLGSADGRSSDRTALFRSTAQALRERAAGGRLLLGVDDAHLLDPASAAMVLYLATQRAATILLTVRSGERWPDAITALWKDGYLTRLDLQALAEEDVGLLLETALGGPVARRTRRWAFERSDGYPLFLRELLLGAVRAGALRQVDGLWRHSAQADPMGRLAELVQARLAGLAAAERAALELVAAGEPLPVAALDGLVGQRQMTELESRGLIAAASGSDGPEVRLAHPLYGELARREMGAMRATAVRRMLADALQAHLGRPADLLRVITWRLDAGETDIDPDLLIAAAEQAAQVFDHALAARLGRAGIDAGGGLPAAMVCARALRAQNDFTGAETLLAAEEDAARSSPLAQEYLSVRLATLLWGLDLPGQVDALLTRAAGWQAAEEWRHCVTSRQVLLWSTAGRFAPAAEAGIALLDEAGLPDDTRLSTAMSTAFALQYLGHGRRALSILDGTAAHGPRSGSAEWSPQLMWAQVALRCGVDWPGVQDRLTGLHRAADHAGDDTLASWVELMLGWAALERGQVATAQRWLRESATGLRAADPRALLPSCLGLLAVAEAQAGNGGQAPATVAAATDAQARRPAVWLGRDEVALAEVWTAAARGDSSAAAELALAHAGSRLQVPLTAGQFLHEALRVGAAASRVVVDLRRAADRTDSALLHAAAGHAEALASSDAAGLEHAARTFAGIGALLRAAEAAADAAAAYGRAGRAASGRAAAAYSASLAARCEGARTPRLRGAAAITLRGRELEVATLAASGLTNAAIAERLTLSVRTVESHVYRASTRLGVSRREDLAVLLGLTPKPPQTPREMP